MFQPEGPSLLGLGAGGARVGAIYIQNSYFIVFWKFHLIQASIPLNIVDFGFWAGWAMMGKKFLHPENPDYTNKDLESILNAKSIREIARSRNLKYLGHVCRQENNAITKRMMFAEPKKNLWEKIA